ncbi:PA2169 family four-helix-bundle protein [Niveibacterium sp. SC-1]|uniref:PA2169 family four-helix-bundle protein n=1 Tax=Niveibacterium sp. SC-1 TaxID=3135646 RepID=UPI00311EB779
MSAKYINTLNDLIENSKDGEAGFKQCAEKADSEALQRLFGARAQECASAAAELQSIVASSGETPETSGTASGALHRGWVSLKAALSRDDDLAMLEECERGEDHALARYRDALKEELPADVRMVVQRQYEGAKRNHDQVRSLRDQARSHA